jgi:hypothetical protein
VNYAAARRWLTTDPFVLLVGVLLFGYLLMSRSFAHLGIRPLYVGEASLAAYLVAKPVSLMHPWLSSLAVPSRLSGFSWWLAASLIYGMLGCMATVFAGSSPVVAGEIYAFNVYPLYLFPGVWVGAMYPHALPKLMRALAWCHGIYGLAFIVVAAPLGLTQNPEEPLTVGIFGHPGGTPIVLLGLLVFERSLRSGFIPFMLNLLVLVGMQRRAEWLSFGVAVAMWASMTGQLRKVFYGGLVILAVLAVGLLPGVKFPSPSLRGTSMSTWDLIGRAIAPLDPKLAREFSPDADAYAATASWRTDFWSEIWDEVHATELRTIFGLGFDYPLWTLHPELLEDQILRTPHNVFMFVLGYSGWLGVLIFFGLQWALARALWRTYRATGEPFGICLWALTIVWAVFDPLLERPFGAIPIYLLLGMAIMQAPRASAPAELPQKLPKSGGLLSARWAPRGAGGARIARREA